MSIREDVEKLTREELVRELVTARHKLVWLKQDLDTSNDAIKLLRAELGIK